MTSQPPQQNEHTGQVLRFTTRTASPPRANRARDNAPDSSPVADLDKYSHDGEPDDFRHRMIMNAVTGVLLAVLIGCGIWLIDTMAQMRRDQDCVLSGRRSCAPIAVQPNNR